MRAAHSGWQRVGRYGRAGERVKDAMDRVLDLVDAIERAGTIDAPVGRHPTQRTRMAVVERGRPAVTHYSVLEQFAPYATLLRCSLETGRTHQIRVHLQSLGHPLVGDPVYGKSRRSALDVLNAFKRQALHAERLTLQHPDSGETLSWQADLPDDFAQLLDALRAAQ